MAFCGACWAMRRRYNPSSAARRMASRRLAAPSLIAERLERIERRLDER
jgi:hypothetical protein